ncbi:MAG: fructosamine kinase family protein [Nitrosomonadales bacterium]|nr:fructosamine kinase family protein [Nitrosomonadales bacterium]
MDISAAIGLATQQPFHEAKRSRIGGGCINQTYCVTSRDDRQFFVKLNTGDSLAMFQAEAAGLNALSATQTIRVPHAITCGATDSNAFLVLEYLDLNAHGDSSLLGEQLAALHRCPQQQFGFAQDNFIGSTLQPNTQASDWLAFWRERRLGFQLRIASQKEHAGQLQSLGEELLDALPSFFAGYSPTPSLLHGDLWNGNHGYLGDGTPVIFDPAAYCGDRESDIAMTELFGGYPADFYAAYRAAWPLDSGYTTRRDLYNLYHILNHANLFGGSYAKQAEQLILKLLAAVR